MTLTVKCQVERYHLIWAVAYLRAHGQGKVVKGQIFKSDVLKFLREQFSRFGTDHCLSEDWEYDYAESLPYAKEWVSKRYPEMGD